MGVSGGCFLVWTSKSREVMKLFLRAARQGLEYAAERELPCQAQVLSRFWLEGVAFALLPAAHPHGLPPEPGPAASGPISTAAGL